MLNYNVLSLRSVWSFLAIILLNYAAVAQENPNFDSQNLVNNASFEELNDCPAEYGAMDEAIGWMSLNFTPDLFNICATDPKVGAPQNYFGNQAPADGNGYAGILAYHERSPLEFIATNLTEPLEKGKKYEVSFKLSWAKIYSNYACDNLGILFTNDLDSAIHARKADIVVDEIISETNWVTISKTIVVGEPYQFIVIGNFAGKEATKTYPFQKSGYPGAYYFLDDIKVVPVDEEANQDSFIKISGNIYDQATQKPVPARIDFVLADIPYRAFEEADATEGRYEFSHMLKSDRFYLEVKSEGYFSQRILVKDNEEAELTKDFYLKPIEIGSSVVLYDIFFESGKATLEEASYPALKLLASFLQEHPEYKIEISGHTDNEGDDGDNLKLSQARAQAVVDYLIDEGFISPKRMIAKGYGELFPIASNEDDLGRLQNRRVELKIIE